MPKSLSNEATSSLPLLTPKAQSHRFRSVFMGILLLSGVVAAITHLGEIQHFAQLARQAQPIWLLIALLLQVGTYVCAAAVWHETLWYGNVHYPLFSLVPLGLAKLFSDQALPSGGVSGTGFFVDALKRRGVLCC